MYKLILVVYLAVNGAGPNGGSVSVSQHEIGQYPSKEACSDAANDALLVNRTKAAAAIGWNFICVSVRQKE
jgi:hypothetical protein